MPFAPYTLKHATISENKVNKSSVGGEVHETSKCSKGNGLNEKVTIYRTIHVDRLRRLELQSMGLQVQCCNHLLFLSWLS